MSYMDPTDGCPTCGTVCTRHADDCTYPVCGPEPDPAPTYPFLAQCRHCGELIQLVGANAAWVPTSGNNDCPSAPVKPALRAQDDPDPGEHSPRYVLSEEYPTPPGVPGADDPVGA